jgi:hypothetical protein
MVALGTVEADGWKERRGVTEERGCRSRERKNGLSRERRSTLRSRDENDGGVGLTF